MVNTVATSERPHLVSENEANMLPELASYPCACMQRKVFFQGGGGKWKDTESQCTYRLEVTEPMGTQNCNDF